eukprot:32104-Prorocentrum_minimum.AAC.4
MTQARRARVMQSFRDGEVNVLVATDVAARGLDVQVCGPSSSQTLTLEKKTNKIPTPLNVLAARGGAGGEFLGGAVDRHVHPPHRAVRAGGAGGDSAHLCDGRRPPPPPRPRGGPAAQPPEVSHSRVTVQAQYSHLVPALVEVLHHVAVTLQSQHSRSTVAAQSQHSHSSVTQCGNGYTQARREFMGSEGSTRRGKEGDGKGGESSHAQGTGAGRRRVGRRKGPATAQPEEAGSMSVDADVMGVSADVMGVNADVMGVSADVICFKCGRDGFQCGRYGRQCGRYGRQCGRCGAAAEEECCQEW